MHQLAEGNLGGRRACRNQALDCLWGPASLCIRSLSQAPSNVQLTGLRLADGWKPWRLWGSLPQAALWIIYQAEGETGTQPPLQSTALPPPQNGVDQSGPVILLLSFFSLQAELLLT